MTGVILSLFFCKMSNERLLSVFVDESGNFGMQGFPLNPAESRFFGGARDFKRNVLKKIKVKEL